MRTRIFDLDLEKSKSHVRVVQTHVCSQQTTAPSMHEASLRSVVKHRPGKVELVVGSNDNNFMRSEIVEEPTHFPVNFQCESLWITVLVLCHHRSRNWNSTYQRDSHRPRQRKSAFKNTIRGVFCNFSCFFFLSLAID